MSIPDFSKPGGGIIERFIPRYLCQRAVLAYQGFGQPFRAMDEFMRIPSLDTEFALIHGAVFRRKGPDEFSIRDFEHHLAAAPTVRTGRPDEFVVHAITRDKWIYYSKAFVVS